MVLCQIKAVISRTLKFWTVVTRHRKNGNGRARDNNERNASQNPTLALSNILLSIKFGFSFRRWIIFPFCKSVNMIAPQQAKAAEPANYRKHQLGYQNCDE